MYIHMLLVFNLLMSSSLYYLHCRRFKSWISTDYTISIEHGKEPSYPSWLFPSHLRPLSNALLTLLLHPDPKVRPSASEALKSPWFTFDPHVSASGGRVSGQSSDERGDFSGTVFSTNHKPNSKSRSLANSPGL